MLADGSIHMTTVRLLAPHLRPDNHRDLLESARGRTKLQIQEIVATLAPKPDVPTTIRRVTTPSPPLASAPIETPSVVTAPAAMPSVVATVAPLSPDRYKLQVTIGGETLEKLRLAQDMLGHALPTGDEAAVLDRALTALLVDLAKKRFADTPRPRASRGTKRGAISAAVKRAVWVRDLGCCAFVGKGGHRCNERRFIQFHHIDPKALGGEATVDQISLRCRRHNDYEGSLYFGRRRREHVLVPEQVGSSITHSAP
jgi:hypothetical protein